MSLADDVQNDWPSPSISGSENIMSKPERILTISKLISKYSNEYWYWLDVNVVLNDYEMTFIITAIDADDTCERKYKIRVCPCDHIPDETKFIQTIKKIDIILSAHKQIYDGMIGYAYDFDLIVFKSHI
jgi:hypothetical protein